MTSSPVPLVETTRQTDRGELVESTHVGHVVVIAPDGTIAATLGDPERVTFVRSSVKPFQATAAYELAGAPDLSNEELAVAWASHRGEAIHLRAVAGLLARAGISPDELTTPPDVPEDDPTASPSRAAHNCSGKHAMFALAGRAIGCPRDQLLDPDGALQQPVLAALAEAMGDAKAVAVDGCGAPAVAVPLAALARGFHRLLVDDRYERVVQAGRAAPLLVGGTGRIESALLARGVVCKPGAEGVIAASWEDDGVWATAIRIEDGAHRASSVALHALLTQAGVVAADVWTSPPVLGGGNPVGTVRATPELAALAL